MTIELLNIDCMKYMATLPDKAFDLAIVDPPYGIGADNHAGNVKNGWKQWDKKSWDNETPKEGYFLEIKRVSANQIIWGANYYSNFLQPSMGWVLWDKGQRDFSLADGELAYTSFNRALRIYSQSRASMLKDLKIHPTQKPVKLYEWLLHNYAKPGQRILDTHLGSGSSAIAAHYFGVDFVGCELDNEYYAAACARVRKETSQVSIFDDL